MSHSLQFLRRSAATYFLSHIVGVSILLLWLMGLSRIYLQGVGPSWRVAIEQRMQTSLSPELIQISTYLYMAIVLASLCYAMYKMGSLTQTRLLHVGQVRRRIVFSLLALVVGWFFMFEWFGSEQGKAGCLLCEYSLPLPNNWVVLAAGLFSLYFAGHVLSLPSIQRLGLWLGTLSVLLMSVRVLLLGEGDLANCISALMMVWLWCSIMFYPLWLAYERADYRRRGQGDIHQTWAFLSGIQVRRRRTFRNYGFLLIAVVPFLAPVWQQGYFIELVRSVGLALIVLAIIGRCWCTLYLGGHKGQSLISAGPYSISRNPLYVFSVMAAVGMGAQSGSACLALLMGGIVYGVFSKVIAEEELLLRKIFADEFDHYCATVPRFWPRWQQWHSPAQLMVCLPALTSTLRDALPYLVSVPLFIGIHWAQTQAYLPVLLRLP